MSPARWLGAVALAASVAAGAWFGSTQFGATASPAPVPKAARAAPAATAPQTKATVEDLSATATSGGTPMAQRVAIIGFLNKRNGESRELVMKPGQAFRVGDAIVRLRACEMTAPWEQDQLTGAFLQLDVQGTDRRWRRSFSGWVFKDRPALNVVQNPVYDVWPKSCTMRFPTQGSDAVAPSAPARPSRARKSPATTGEPVSSPATESPSAELSNTL